MWTCFWLVLLSRCPLVRVTYVSASSVVAIISLSVCTSGLGYPCRSFGFYGESAGGRETE